MWRFEGGTVDGSTIPDGDEIELRIGSGFVQFPVDCNTASGRVSSDGSTFLISEVFSSNVGCAENTQRADLFAEALGRATGFSRDADALVVSGESIELRFAWFGSGDTTITGWMTDIRLDAEYRGIRVGDGFEVGRAEVRLESGEEMIIPAGTRLAEVCLDLPIDGESISDEPCYLAGSVDAAGIPGGVRVFAYRPMFDGSSDPHLWTEVTAFTAASWEAVTLVEDGIALRMSADATISCLGVTEAANLVDAPGPFVVEIDEHDGQVAQIFCR